MKPCQVCGEPLASPQEIWMEVGAVEIGLRCLMCDVCHTTAPEKVRRELQSPMIRTLLTIAGAKVGLKIGAATASAPSAPRR